MTVAVIPMAAKHLPAVARLEQQCFSTPWSEAALAEELAQPFSYLAVAVADGAVAGYVGLQIAADEGYITNVAVDPHYRRRGVATALIRHLAAEALARGWHALFLEVRASSTAAVALYEREGFTFDGCRPRFYRNPTEDARLYSRRFD